MYLTKFISENDNLTFSFENQFKRFSYISILPVEANASSGKNENGKIVSWFQLVSNYKTSYDRVDEFGTVHQDDNNTIKQFILKISNDYMNKYNLTTNELKEFFIKNFVGQKFITLPINEETPVFIYNNNQRNLVKNQSQAFINENFNLKEFIKSFEKDKK